jgi:hypothetical protein
MEPELIKKIFIIIGIIVISTIICTYTVSYYSEHKTLGAKLSSTKVYIGLAIFTVVAAALLFHFLGDL